MENGNWKMENGKWKMENGKWKMKTVYGRFVMLSFIHFILVLVFSFKYI